MKDSTTPASPVSMRRCLSGHRRPGTLRRPGATHIALRDLGKFDPTIRAAFEVYAEDPSPETAEACARAILRSPLGRALRLLENVTHKDTPADVKSSLVDAALDTIGFVR